MAADLAATAHLVWEASAGLFSLILVFSVIIALVPAATLWVGKLLIDAVALAVRGGFATPAAAGWGQPAGSECWPAALCGLTADEERMLRLIASAQQGEGEMASAHLTWLVRRECQDGVMEAVDASGSANGGRRDIAPGPQLYAVTRRDPGPYECPRMYLSPDLKDFSGCWSLADGHWPEWWSRPSRHWPGTETKARHR